MGFKRSLLPYNIGDSSVSNIKLVHSGGNSVSLTTPTSNPSSNITFKLPQADGSAGQVLQTDGNGNLSWTSPSKILQVLENVRADASTQVVNSGATYEPTFLRQSITTTGSNKVLIEGFVHIAMTSPGNSIMVGLRRDGSNVGHGVASGNKRTCTASSFHEDSYNLANIHFSFLDSPSAGTHEYYLQISHSSGGNQTLYFNRTADDTNSIQYPRCISLIRCSEVAA